MLQDDQIEFYKEKFDALQTMVAQLEDSKAKELAQVKLATAYKWVVASIKE